MSEPSQTPPYSIGHDAAGRLHYLLPQSDAAKFAATLYTTLSRGVHSSDKVDFDDATLIRAFQNAFENSPDGHVSSSVPSLERRLVKYLKMKGALTRNSGVWCVREDIWNMSKAKLMQCIPGELDKGQGAISKLLTPSFEGLFSHPDASGMTEDPDYSGDTILHAVSFLALVTGNDPTSPGKQTQEMSDLDNAFQDLTDAHTAHVKEIQRFDKERREKEDAVLSRIFDLHAAARKIIPAESSSQGKSRA